MAAGASGNNGRLSGLVRSELLCNLDQTVEALPGSSML